MNKELKSGLILTAVIALIVFLVIGPMGCERHLQSWKNGAYGADWLVVQYTGMGDPMNFWELNGKSIGNESQSDGIFFIDNEGNIVHLSGQYMYIQIKSGQWDAAKKLYLKTK